MTWPGAIWRWLRPPKEYARGPWLRGTASLMALAAGAIHLGQVGVHMEEGWVISGFFLMVGTVQLMAAGLLLRAWPATWVWFGIIGSATVIAIWLISRTIGLPFGAEPGQAEPVGTADAAASLCEAVTVVVLALWLSDRSAVSGRTGYGAAVVVVVGLGVAWAATRATGLFEPDPRATIGLPQLADRAALALVAGVALILVLLAAFPASSLGWWRAVMRGLLVAAFVASGALVVLTLPTAGGQNASCAYAPLAEVSRLSHVDAPPPARLAVGEERWFGALVISACGSEAVRVEQAEILNFRGPGEVLDYALLPGGERLPAEGAPDLPSGLRGLGSSPILRPGEVRQLAVLLRGGEGRFSLDSLRISYRVADRRGTVAFAAILVTCPPATCISD